jgi:hypothetical protein
MSSGYTPWWIWGLPVLLVSPWLVAVALCLRGQRGNRDVPPSMADLARRRLWSQ